MAISRTADRSRKVEQWPGNARRASPGAIEASARWRRIALFTAIVALAPAPVLAHVKWFENEAHYPVRADLVFSGRTGVLLVAAGAALAVFYTLQRKVGDPHWPDFGFLKRMAVGAPTLLAVQAAAWAALRGGATNPVRPKYAAAARGAGAGAGRRRGADRL